jgi:hypothetical protein
MYDDDDEDDDEDDSDEWTTDDDDTESDSDNEESTARKNAARRAGQPSKPRGPEPPSQEVLKFLRQQLPRPVLLSRTTTSLTLSILARKDALEAWPLKGRVGGVGGWVGAGRLQALHSQWEVFTVLRTTV